MAQSSTCRAWLHSLFFLFSITSHCLATSKSLGVGSVVPWYYLTSGENTMMIAVCSRNCWKLHGGPWVHWCHFQLFPRSDVKTLTNNELFLKKLPPLLLALGAATGIRSQALFWHGCWWWQKWDRCARRADLGAWSTHTSHLNVRQHIFWWAFN